QCNVYYITGNGFVNKQNEIIYLTHALPLFGNVYHGYVPDNPLFLRNPSSTHKCAKVRVFSNNLINSCLYQIGQHLLLKRDEVLPHISLTYGSKGKGKYNALTGLNQEGKPLRLHG